MLSRQCGEASVANSKLLKECSARRPSTILRLSSRFWSAGPTKALTKIGCQPLQEINGWGAFYFRKANLWIFTLINRPSRQFFRLENGLRCGATGVTSAVAVFFYTCLRPKDQGIRNHWLEIEEAKVDHQTSTITKFRYGTKQMRYVTNFSPLDKSFNYDPENFAPSVN